MVRVRLTILLVILSLAGCSVLSGRNLARITCEFPDDPLTLAPNWVCNPSEVGVVFAEIGHVSVVNQPALAAQKYARNQAASALASRLLATVSEVTGLPERTAQAALPLLQDLPVLGSRRSPNDELYVVVGVDQRDWLTSGRTLITSPLWSLSAQQQAQALLAWQRYGEQLLD